MRKQVLENFGIGNLIFLVLD